MSDRFGGTWTYTTNLVRSLLRYADDVDLIVLANGLTAEHFRALSADVITVNLPSYAPPLRVVWEHLRLSPLVKRMGRHVLHAAGNVLPAGINSPSVLTVHDFQYHFFPNNFSWAKRLYLDVGMRNSIHRATRVICVSDSTRIHAAALCPSDTRKFRVVHEAGLADGEKSSCTGCEELRSRLNLSVPFVLYAGSGFPHKNLPRLIQAFGQITDAVPHSLVITGELFGYEESIRMCIRDAGIPSNRVRMTGFVSRSDLLGLYSTADCYILPSLFEGFGISILEAMECGCPVIASDRTALPEIGGDAVKYCDPENVQSIAGTLNSLLNDSIERIRIKEKGLIRAADFSWDQVARNTIQVYKEIAEEGA